jgi:hypothetical protein
MKVVCHHFQLGLKPIFNNESVFSAMLVFYLGYNININNIKGLGNRYVLGWKKMQIAISIAKIRCLNFFEELTLVSWLLNFVLNSYACAYM